jgi:hypothetical protein
VELLQDEGDNDAEGKADALRMRLRRLRNKRLADAEEDRRLAAENPARHRRRDQADIVGARRALLLAQPKADATAEQVAAHWAGLQGAIVKLRRLQDRIPRDAENAAALQAELAARLSEKM